MKLFKLENLPKISLLEVFSYVESWELLDMRFLNKDLFNVVGNVINHHLRYSSYHNTPSFIDVQNDFIKKNCTVIKHLVIPNDTLFKYSQRIRRGVFITQFNELESLNILFDKLEYINRISTLLRYFKDLIFKVERVEIDYTFDDNVDIILKLLDPKKIIYLNLLANQLTLNTMNKIKEFKKLKTLELDIEGLDYTINHIIEPNASVFPVLERLVMSVRYYNSIYNSILHISWFGNLSQLKYLELGLLEYTPETVQFIENNDSIEKIKFNYKLLDYHNMGIEELLNYINQTAKIKNCKIIEISIVNKEEFKEYNGNEHSFLHVQEIIFTSSTIDIQFIFNLLKYFPNVKKVKFKNGVITNYENLPIYVLNNNKDFMFCIHFDSLNCSSEVLDLFTDINILVIN